MLVFEVVTVPENWKKSCAKRSFWKLVASKFGGSGRLPFRRVSANSLAENRVARLAESGVTESRVARVAGSS